MAKEKKSGGGVGGCLVQVVLGVLAAIATILAALFFMSGPFEGGDGHTTADDAAANAVQPEVAPETPAPKAETTPQVPPQHDAGIDPSSDDQIAEDAAAAGMTSRTPSTPGE